MPDRTDTPYPPDRMAFHYLLALLLLRFTFCLYFRFFPRRNVAVPRSGPLVVIANHQSYLDPLLVASTLPRGLRFLARSSLFRNSFLSALIRLFGALPVEREGIGLGGLKLAEQQLKNGKAVLLFPEGTRTKDGSIGSFHPGFLWLAMRCGVPVLPVVLDGAMRALPRKGKFPKPVRIKSEILEAVQPNEMQPLEGENAKECRNRLAEVIRMKMIEVKKGL